MADPLIIAVAGAPGSGKSSFIEDMSKKNLFSEDYFIHDCDGLMVSLEGYNSDLRKFGSAQAFENWELYSRDLAESQLLEAVNLKRNIIYDCSCALHGSYDFLKDSVDQFGYTLVMYVMYVSEDEAIARAKNRETQTGRHIPESVIRERKKGICSLWPSYVNLAKKCYLIDSKNHSYEMIAIAEDGILTVLQPDIYENFLEGK